MTRRFLRFPFPFIVTGALFFGALCCGTARAQQPVSDWVALDTLQKQLKGEEPQAAIDAYQKLFESRPKMLPPVAVRLTQRVVELYGEKLQKWDKVVEIDEWALQQYPKQPDSVLLLDNEIKALTTLKRLDEAAKACEKHWPTVLSGGQPGEEWLVMFTASALRGSCEAYEELKQPDKSIVLLTAALTSMPLLLEDTAQGMGGWKTAWMYEMLVRQLIEAGRVDEALGWAKLQYMTGPADQPAIDRAAKSAGRAWGEREEYQSLRAFTRSQEDNAPPDAENPLEFAKLPALDAKIMRENLARTEIPPKGPFSRSKTKERLFLFLALGDCVSAMQEAGKLYQDLPKNPEGSQNVQRVLKAGDFNLRRAQQFTQFLDGGKAPDPLPGFFKDMAIKAKTPRVPKPKPAPTTATPAPPVAPAIGTNPPPAKPTAPPEPNPFAPNKPSKPKEAAPASPPASPPKGDSIP